MFEKNPKPDFDQLMKKVEQIETVAERIENRITHLDVVRTKSPNEVREILDKQLEFLFDRLTKTENAIEACRLSEEIRKVANQVNSIHSTWM